MRNYVVSYYPIWLMEKEHKILSLMSKTCTTTEQKFLEGPKPPTVNQCQVYTEQGEFSFLCGPPPRISILWPPRKIGPRQKLNGLKKIFFIEGPKSLKKCVSTTKQMCQKSSKISKPCSHKVLDT